MWAGDEDDDEDEEDGFERTPPLIQPRLFMLKLLALLLALAIPAVADDRYERRADHDPNGIGLFYMGREIAHVMGHLGADWLERPERQQEERTDLLIDALKLKPGDMVADIGAGTGYIAEKMARRILPGGVVYGVEIQPEMLDLMGQKMKELRITNVKPQLGTVTDPKLPEGTIDLIIMVDVYHEFDHPYEMTESMIKALKKGGRLVFVEYRKEDPAVPIKLVHKMTEAQVKKEMAQFPQLEWAETNPVLPQQHIIVFRKK
jgi:SAM-dependent methyltransferase